MSSTGVIPSRWWFRWAATSLCASVLATIVDAALLQRSRSYFTGGFLAVDSARTATDVAGFVSGSLIADLGVLSVVAGLVLWIAGRVGVRWPVAFVLALLAALIPVAATDFAEYELASYLGDAFDLKLMFDLSGRDPGEILAVASAHVTAILLVGVPLVAVLVWLGVVAGRAWSSGASWAAHPRFVVSLIGPVLMLILAATSTTLLRRGSDVLDNGLRRKPTGQWLGTLVNRLSDVDNDGYGVLGRPPDPDLFDAQVQPYAVEIAGNQIDEDGVAGDLPAGQPPYREGPARAPTWVRRPDVILVVLESFRADAVGAVVQGRPVTPVIDAIAREGVAASVAYSHNGYTVQARHHIFSGSTADIRGGTSLIDDFRANGYETAYFSGQDESFGGSAYEVGFKRADVAYDARVDRDKRSSTFSTPGSLGVPNAVLVQRVTDFLERRSRDKPLFLYVNLYDTHFPYHHPGIDPLVSAVTLTQAEISPAHRDELRAMYFNTAANVDRALGRVLEVARRHLAHEPGLVVMADHGESLFDEGFLGHGYALNGAQTRIPFVIANLPATLTEPVGQADLRDVLWTALTQADGSAPPRIVQDRSRRVFQYLGTIDRPAQIAFTSLDTQILYDFRDSRVRLDHGNWVSPEGLSDRDAKRWRELVTTWERMIIARATPRAAP